jgi:mevalonate kinase
LKSFPSKILLFGEYGILKGSVGLAIPYPAYSGIWVLPKSQKDKPIKENARRSNRHLRFLLDYLETQPEFFNSMKASKFRKDIEKGLYFESNIPEGYGLGSSGALTAALLYRYAKPEVKKLLLPEIRQILASIEKFFHGTSSGLDPLVSWVNKPVLIQNDGTVSTLAQIDLPFGIAGSDLPIEEIDTGKVDIFLVDTNTPSKTGNLVNWFLEEYNNFEFRRAVNEVYLPATQQAVDLFLLNKSNDFLNEVASISAFQMQYFSPMVPSQMIDHLDYGLSTDKFYLKLCGSGGGGFMLGFTKNMEDTKSYFVGKGLSIQVL